MTDRELTLLTALHHGRERETRHIRDLAALRSLERQGLVQLTEGRPTVPRSSSDFHMLFKRGRTTGMVTHIEAHLTAKGLRALTRKEPAT